MTSFICHTEPEQALIAMDTLGVDPDGKPFLFTTKFYVVPHLKLVICGTGAGSFIGEWFIKANERMIVRGIDNLDYHTPGMLNKLWAAYREEYHPLDDHTATVYHIGFSEETDLIRTYVYRSTDNFASETRDYGLMYKPECTIPENYVFPQDIKSLMEEQRKIQLTKPRSERIYIGGEIFACQLSKAGIGVYSLGQFDDYDSDLGTIFRNYKDNQAAASE
jgi:hypothetical protein